MEVKGEFMKLQLEYTLEQLLEVYGKKAKVPMVLANEKIFIYGLEFWIDFKRQETCIDKAVEEYLGTGLLVRDLVDAEKVWKERASGSDYTLNLVTSSTSEVRLKAMVKKDF